MIDQPLTGRLFAVVGGLLAAWLALAGCEDTGGDSAMESSAEDWPPSVIAAPLLNVAANAAATRSPVDATPSPDGDRIYYLATATGDGADEAGVFSVAGDGAGEIETLAVGGALSSPGSISVSVDGERLFVADIAMSTDAGQGAVMTLASSGGDEPVVVPGTEGYAPRGLVLAEVDGESHLYFTGTDPESRLAGVFRVPPDGGDVETLATGEPFSEPTGVAVTNDGTVYVVDADAATAERGEAAVMSLREDEVETVIDGIGAGPAAGIAVTLDASTLLVSGLDPESRRDRVYVLDTKSSKLAQIVEPFDSFSRAAGLHRAHNANVFAWADGEANDWGTVYRVRL
jgi:sugar lactone lactonase YvrE